MSSTAKLFMSGRSLWVQPQAEAASDMGVWLQDFYANTAPLPEDFLAERGDTPPQERVWD